MLGEWFNHDGEEFLYLLEGDFELELRGHVPEQLRPGDSAWYDSSASHVGGRGLRAGEGPWL